MAACETCQVSDCWQVNKFIPQNQNRFLQLFALHLKAFWTIASQSTVFRRVATSASDLRSILMDLFEGANISILWL